MSVVLVAVAFVAGVRFRYAVGALALTVVIATFGLGIHWLPDIVTGVALGVLSVALAVRLEERRRRRAAVTPRREPGPGSALTAA